MVIADTTYHRSVSHALADLLLVPLPLRPRRPEGRTLLLHHLTVARRTPRLSLHRLRLLSQACSHRWLRQPAPWQLAQRSDTGFRACSSVEALASRQRLLLSRHPRCSRPTKPRLLAARSMRRVSRSPMFLRFLAAYINTEFTKCLEKADLPSCSWYLEQLKAVSPLTSRRSLFSDVLNQCQAAASPY